MADELRKTLTAAYEADAEAAKHRAKLKEMASLPLGGKATKMGEGYIVNKDNTVQNETAAEQAYDAVANLHESAAEDAEENSKQAIKRRRAAPLLIDAPASKKQK